MLPVEVNPQFIAPMGPIYQNWSSELSLNLDWYFDVSSYLKAQKIIFPFVDFNSPLFTEIQKSTLARQFKPVFVLHVGDFLKLENPEHYLSMDIELALVIDHWPEPVTLSQIKKTVQDHSNLKFIIVARKDWDFVTLYRSLPFWMRENFYLDFPTSLHETDPFLNDAEVLEVSTQLVKFFPDIELKSFAPDLRLYAENKRASLKLLSQPRKLNLSKPQLTLVVRDQESLLALTESKIIAEMGDHIEILEMRLSREKASVYPKIKSVTTTTYWFDNEPQEISLGLIHNFFLSQASAESVLFVDRHTAQNWDSLWIEQIKPLLGQPISSINLLNLKNASIKENLLSLFCSKEGVARSGGFNHLLRSGQALSIKVQGPASEQVRSRGAVQFQSHLTFQDRKILKTKKSSIMSASSSPQEERPTKNKNLKFSHKIYDLYFKIWQNKPQVILESHLSLLKKPFTYFYQRHYWRLPIMFERVKSNTWRLKVMVLFIRSQLWRLSPQQIGWRLFKLAWPIRKIYYFLVFQYEKRFLGLHKNENLKS